MHEPSGATIFAVIAGMAVVNFGLRFTPLALLSRVEFPPAVLRWLSYIPISVMGALVASEVFRSGGQWRPVLSNPAVPAALLTMAAYKLSRSFLGATVVGVISFLAIRAALG